MRPRLFCFVLLTSILSLPLSLPKVYSQESDPLDASIKLGVRSQQEAIQSQTTINQLSDATTKALREYRTLLRQTDSVKVYNTQLEKLIHSQQTQLNSLKQQLTDIDITEREIMPFILRMVDHLVQFVALDLPFLVEERQTRLSQLQQLMDDADASLAEKYRRTMEAYLVEIEYGRNIETYQSLLAQDNSKRTVDFLRIGRIALYYLSLDSQQAGYWNNTEKNWQNLPETYQPAINRGIRMARKHVAPDLLTLPVTAPVNIQ